ncbi:carbamoyl-phosphate synthase large subunit [Natranaerofaba carboxydovora]|uniref:carbamoyl-phosphate synthase large subunit n=1 Tax=Natranaerofaba carboxydovora TaxID=2742683 RepID=UPI001F12D6D4|nr:carbamoyl-phosphate synthase large subunit [Natranaerofaba carboxydovora]UMZ73873.1 Carbamoyl-phosphate synthase large chain [Natranaerofaba carboxydovora]
MPKIDGIKKVLVIGSGPIIIGQAAEFDYAGTQACRTLKEEGIEVVLVNSNPATIMTDKEMAHKVYLEPLNKEYIEEIIMTERPDGLLSTLGGQVGLNMAEELSKSGVLERYNVKLLGTPLEAISKAEDRNLFRDTMIKLNEPIPESTIVSTKEEALDFARKIGFPVIVRPAYTLGGTGGGIAYNEEELEQTASRGLYYSMIKQLLIEKSVYGWKEIEYEVIRDSSDNCMIVCDMENFDPVGVHTGDSIVAAPSQTLTDEEQKMLREASFNIIRELNIEGGCNIQFALNSETKEYYVIEVNPRLSRSSALASKATSYPIARVATKISLGYTLKEIKNEVFPQITADVEPDVKYTVLKIPRWPFDKFESANRTLGTQMKATGEVMSLGNNFEIALLKAIRSLEQSIDDLKMDELSEWTDEKIEEVLEKPDDRRLWCITEAFRRGYNLEDIKKSTWVSDFFLEKLEELIELEKELEKYSVSDEQISKELMKEVKYKGFSDKRIARLTDKTLTEITNLRKEYDITPEFKKVDAFSGGKGYSEISSYYYSSYFDEGEEKEENNNTEESKEDKVVVIGSGPIRIGQGIEFDYCSVHSAWSLNKAGVKSIVINNNPETVSTDHDVSDKLYFEPLDVEDVMNVIEKEEPKGVIVQFGGQTSINLARPLMERGVEILGTNVENMDLAEDREKFGEVLTKLDIPYPKGETARSQKEAENIAKSLGFPVLVRPSYVLGGRAMEIVDSLEELKEYLEMAVKVSPDYPVLVDSYLRGREVEVDAVSDGNEVLIPGVMEHIEMAGIHSGDSTAVYPARTFSDKVLDKLVDYTTKLARELNIIGVINIQYVVYEDEVYVLEVNPRSSRTVPFVSKVSDIPLIDIATQCMLGKTISEQGYCGGLYTPTNLSAVKMPVFSFAKLLDVETSLGPEMKSTGEVLGLDRDYTKSMYKAFLAAGFEFAKQGTILVTISDKDKEEALPILKDFYKMGYNLLATEGTAKMLAKEDIKVEVVNKVSQGSPHVVDYIRDNKVDMVINTFTRGKKPQRDGFKIRRAGVEYGVPCVTSLDTLSTISEVLKSMVRVHPLQEYNSELDKEVYKS